MIDEGQKLPVFCLEVLRELLNYETNDHKLLQIIIFAQKEFNESLEKLNNFNDRISFRFSLSPLGFSETKALIQFRLEKAAKPGTKIPHFSFFAYLAIYRYTKGFPRKIINLCHHILLGLIIKNHTAADYFFVKSCAKEVFGSSQSKNFTLAYATLTVLVFIGCALWFNIDQIPTHIFPVQKASVRVDFPVAPVVTPSPAVAQLSLVSVKPEINSDEIQVQPQKTLNTIPIVEQPQFYGGIRVPKNETLCNMIETVYGSYRKEYLEKLLKTNSNIKNPDQINAGMLIHFPIISDLYSFWEKENFCIVLSKETEFKEAFWAVKKYQQMGINSRILPGWDKRNGFLFSVVVDKPFQNLAEATIYTKQLIGVNDIICEKVSACSNGRKIL